MNAVNAEVSVAQAVNDAGLRAPRYFDTVQINGRGGIVYERVDGLTMLDDLARRPWTIFRAARQFTDLHLSIHAITRENPPPQRARLTSAI